MTGNEEFTGPIINRDFVTGPPLPRRHEWNPRRGMHGDKSVIFFFPFLKEESRSKFSLID